MRLVLLGLMLALVGCQHTHLRHNTVHQAKTLAEIYEQQVLDNLAKTVHDAHALPFFAYPEDGSTNIEQEANIAATPFNNFTNVFGINGKRSGLEQWGLIPVSDPDKLQLMQCAYQRAVYGQPLSDCAKCCDLERKFEAPGTTKLKVCDAEPGNDSCPPDHLHTDGHYYPVDKEGFANVPKHDCDGPCAIKCGWIGHGRRCDVPDDCCFLTGFHCGTYVWVPKCHRGKLSQLTLKILDYAVNDPAKLRTKNVTIFVDEFGRQTAEDEHHVGTVTAQIGIDDLVSSVLVIDKSAAVREQDRQKTLLNTELDVLNVNPEAIQEIRNLLEGTPIDSTDAEAFKKIDLGDDFSEDKLDAVNRAVNRYLERVKPDITPSTPSQIPKQRTRRGDGYQDVYDTQRKLNAIEN